MSPKSLALLAAAALLAGVLVVVVRSVVGGEATTQAAARAKSPGQGTTDEIVAPGRELASGTPPTTPPGTPVPPSGFSDPEDALASIAELGARLGTALDLVTPTPELSVLRELRKLVEGAGLSAERLLDAAKKYPLGDPRARALTLSTAWGRGLDVEGDRQLLELAHHAVTALPGGQRIRQEQHALAAIWALDLGERTAALESYARTAIEAAQSTAGELEFEGLANLRAWFALRAVPAAGEGAVAWDALFTKLDRVGQDRVARELWALATRSNELQGASALGMARSGLDPARQGIASITATRYTKELATLALDPVASAQSGWLAGAALQGLVGTATKKSMESVGKALKMGDVRRDQALEALRTWRPQRNPARQAAKLFEFAAELEADAHARQALEQGLARALDWTLIRRLDSDVRADLRAVLDDAELHLDKEHPLHAQLEAWREAL